MPLRTERDQNGPDRNTKTYVPSPRLRAPPPPQRTRRRRNILQSALTFTVYDAARPRLSTEGMLPMSPVNVGVRIRQLRFGLGMSMRTLATKTGFSPSLIYGLASAH